VKTATTTARDNNVWKSLPAFEDGYIGAVRRRWMFVGESRGQKCRFEVELLDGPASVSGEVAYRCRAVFAHNCWFEPGIARMSELEPVS